MKLRLCIALACLLLLSGCDTERSLEGTWVNAEGDYTIWVPDSSITDGLYGVPMSYTRADQRVTYTDPAGNVITTQVRFDSNRVFSAYLGGTVRTFTRTQDSEPTRQVVSAKSGGTTFTRKSSVGPLSVALHDDKSFAILHDQYSAVGLYAEAYDQSYVTLYYTDGDISAVDVWVKVPSSRLLCGYPLEFDGALLATPKMANKAAEVPTGYLLDGVVGYPGFSTTFDFTGDGKCVKRTAYADSITYNYTVGSEGLITLSDETGILNSYDYMYYSAECNTIYRVVLETSSWDSYLQQIVSENTSTSCATDLDYSVTVPPLSLLFMVLGDSYAGNSEYIWENLEEADVDYTLTACNEITTELARIQADAIARREYEQSLLSEQERFLEQVRELEEAEALLRAEMDARAQAAIAESQSTLADASSSSESLYTGDSSFGYVAGFVS